MKSILLVEDDKGLQEVYGIRLEAEGYKLFFANNGEEAIKIATKEHIDLILSDVMMPKISGFDMLDILKSNKNLDNTKIIIMTALSSDNQRAKGEALGVDRYLVKSQLGIEDVVNAVNEVLNENSQNVQETAEPVAPVANTEPIQPEAPTINPTEAVDPIQSENNAPALQTEENKIAPANPIENKEPINQTEEPTLQTATPKIVSAKALVNPNAAIINQATKNSDFHNHNLEHSNQIKPQENQSGPLTTKDIQPESNSPVELTHEEVPDRQNFSLKDIIPPR